MHGEPYHVPEHSLHRLWHYHLVLNIWNVTYGRGNHILKLFSGSVNAKTETLLPE